ncbi:hypothetical protein [Alcanivorax sp.]|uniref:hypothetical protein n=1 Tax=Alcanivorax sp. TaxID=1872427 RepID=UPI0032D8F169
MNKEIRHGLVAALLLVSAGTQAAMSATELALVQADAWRVRMGFHLLSIRGDNPEDRVALKALLANGEQQLDALTAQAAPGEKETATQLDASWEALSDRALDNPLASLGYADYSAMSEINTTTLAVDALVREADAAGDATYLDIARLSVAMQRLASEYAALAAFPSAGLKTGTGLQSMNFGAEARAIDESLVSLKGKYAGDAKAREVLAFIDQRWTFVRKSIPGMDDPNTQKIPYLFYRYATQMAERVSELTQP